MSGATCEHDTTTFDVNEKKLARYMREGAVLLDGAAFGFASEDGRPGPDHIFDMAYWKIGGDWGRDPNVNILVVKDGVTPATAVREIFEHPEKWSFDCSQFVQVVTLYGWLKLLGAAKFNQRVLACGGRGIQIRPFQGSVFSLAQRRYWRESRDRWMIDILNPASQPRLTVREIVDSAPIGSRVMFRNDDRAINTAFRNENAIKAGFRRYAAHPFGVVSEDEVTLHLYRNIRGEASATLAEAKRHVWIKEVDYYLEPVLVSRARRRMLLNSIRASQRIMHRL